MAKERKLSLAERLKTHIRQSFKYPTQIEDSHRRFSTFLGLVQCDGPTLTDEEAWNIAKELSDLHLKPGEQSTTPYIVNRKCADFNLVDIAKEKRLDEEAKIRMKEAWNKELNDPSKVKDNNKRFFAFVGRLQLQGMLKTTDELWAEAKRLTEEYNPNT